MSCFFLKGKELLPGDKIMAYYQECPKNCRCFNAGRGYWYGLEYKRTLAEPIRTSTHPLNGKITTVWACEDGEYDYYTQEDSTYEVQRKIVYLTRSKAKAMKKD